MAHNSYEGQLYDVTLQIINSTKQNGYFHCHMYVQLNFQLAKFYIINLATDFYVILGPLLQNFGIIT